MAASPGADPAQQEEGKKPGGIAESSLGPVGMILAALGGGIGALSVVAFFGAAIIWVRMDKVGIPANEAIAIVPRSVLVTTGASFLVPPVLFAVVLLGLLYLVDRLIGWIIDFSFLREETRALAEAEKAAKRRQASVDLALENVAQAAPSSPHLEAAEKAAEAGAEKAADAGAEKAGEAGANPAAPSQGPEKAGKAVIEAVAMAKEEVEFEREKKPAIEFTRNGARFVSVAIVLALAAVPGVMLSTVGLSGGQLVLVILAVLFLAAVCMAVLASTNFAGLALSIVVAVGLLNGFITYCRTKNDPKVEPVAVLRSGGAPVFGFFVAQTSDRVYLGTRLPTGPLRLDSIPREEVTDMAVGEALRPEAARPQARRLARQICVVARERAKEEQAVVTASGKKPAREPCTSADLRRLSGPAPNAGGTPAV